MYLPLKFLAILAVSPQYFEEVYVNTTPALNLFNFPTISEVQFRQIMNLRICKRFSFGAPYQHGNVENLSCDRNIRTLSVVSRYL